ncbi:MAG: hypothetical protein HOC20_06215 [Chloroflexi bacterium]|nr:hypothetical protein [Chloroflexota bacterium]
MNSRIGRITSAFMFVLLSFSFLYSQTDTPIATISLDTVDVSPGDTAVITLTFHSQTPAGGFQFDLVPIPATGMTYVSTERVNLPSCFTLTASCGIVAPNYLKTLVFGLGCFLDTTRIELMRIKYFIESDAYTQTVNLALSNVKVINEPEVDIPHALINGVINVTGGAVDPGTLDPWSLSGSIYQGKQSDIFIIAANDSAIDATTLELHFDNTVLQYMDQSALAGRASEMSLVPSTLGNPAYGARMVIYSLTDKTIGSGYGNIAKVALQPVDNIEAGTTTMLYLTHKSAKDTLASAEITVLSSNGLPYLMDPGPHDINVGEAFLLQLYGEDLDGDSVSYGVQPFGRESEYSLSSLTGEFAWTPTETGTYTVTFTISDGKNESSQQVDFTVIEGNVAPEWDTESVILQATEGQPLNHTFTAPTDFNQDAITVTANNLPEQAQFDTGSLTLNWTPAYDDEGDHEFILTASDPDNAQNSLYVTIEVANNNQPPQITCIPSEQVGPL